MSTFESTVKSIPYAQTKVYAKIADLSHLAALKEKLGNPEHADKLAHNIPQDKLEEVRKVLASMKCDTDSLTIETPMGGMRLRVVEREEPKLVKLEGEGTPIPINLWIQLLPHGDEGALMKVTIKAELNVFIKPMVSKPLKEGVEKMADLLAGLPYGD